MADRFGAATIAPPATGDNDVRDCYIHPDMDDHDPVDKASPISAERMEKAAYDYLARYLASAETLRRVLARRVRRAAITASVDREAAEKVIAQIVAKFQANGLIDDQRFADARAASLARRGDSPRAIQAKLAQKGVDAKTARCALARLAADSEGDLELTSAMRLAERRRLGPFRARDRADYRDRDLAALARAGHSVAVARTVIDAAHAEELRVLVAQSVDDS